MLDDVSDIAAYYSNDPEREHSRLERHQLEYDLTWRYLNRYLPSQGTILEIGAATGQYTLELAKRGYSITAVDLSARLLDECKESITKAGLRNQVQFIVADARCLRKVPEKDFDVVLLMGPLYHLTVESDRKAALKEPAISADDESYNDLQGKQRQLWLDLLYEISTEKSIVGASRHLLYIGRKK